MLVTLFKIEILKGKNLCYFLNNFTYTFNQFTLRLNITDLNELFSTYNLLCYAFVRVVKIFLTINIHYLVVLI